MSPGPHQLNKVIQEKKKGLKHFQRHHHAPGTFRGHLPPPLALRCCDSSASRPLLSLRKLTKWKRNNMARLAMLCVTDNNPKWGRGDVDELSKSCESVCRLYIVTWRRRLQLWKHSLVSLLTDAARLNRNSPIVTRWDPGWQQLCVSVWERSGNKVGMAAGVCQWGPGHISEWFQCNK